MMVDILLEFVFFELLAVETEVVGHFFAGFALLVLALGAVEPIFCVVFGHRGRDGGAYFN